MLEAENLPVAAVSAICGISRFEVMVTGTTGHAGTVPMSGRQDALVAASRIIALVSDEAMATEVRATVGSISVGPGAVNAIPSRVRFTLEIRAASDATRVAFETGILGRAQEICAAAGCEGVLGLAAHPREARFATAGDDGSVRLWDAHHRRMELARLHFET